MSKIARTYKLNVQKNKLNVQFRSNLQIKCPKNILNVQVRRDAQNKCPTPFFKIVITFLKMIEMDCFKRIRYGTVNSKQESLKD